MQYTYICTTSQAACGGWVVQTRWGWLGEGDDYGEGSENNEDDDDDDDDADGDDGDGDDDGDDGDGDDDDARLGLEDNEWVGEGKDLVERQRLFNYTQHRDRGGIVWWRWCYEDGGEDDDGNDDFLWRGWYFILRST